MPEQTRLDGPDIAAVTLYMVLVFGIGMYAAYRQGKGLQGYFLASRSMWWAPLGCSMFISNIGAEHLEGLAGSGAAKGISVGAWELSGLVLLQALSWVFLPVYLACRIATVPEYMSKRFGGARLRVLLALISIILYIATRISADLFTGGIFLQQALGWDIYASIFGLVGLASFIAVLGGLRAVIYTETLQAVVLTAGCVVLAWFSFREVGGFWGLVEKYPATDVCGKPNDPWQMLRSADDPYVPWAGFVFGQMLSSTWYWCTDMVIVQRVLAARSLAHGKGATILGSFLKVLPMWTMIFPGMASRVLFPNEVGCNTPEACERVCQNRAGCSNTAYVKLVMHVLPKGFKGVLLAALMASLMGSFESTLNSSSSLFTMDILPHIYHRPCTEAQRLRLAKVFLVVITAISIAWIPMAAKSQGGQVFIYLQEIINYLAPEIAATYILGLAWPRCTEKGAFWGLMTGFAFGMIRLILTFAAVHSAGEICRPAAKGPLAQSPFLSIHYFYFGTALFLGTVLVAVVFSLLDEPPPTEQLEDTTFWSYWTRDQRLLAKASEKVVGDEEEVAAAAAAGAAAATATAATSADVSLRANVGGGGSAPGGDATALLPTALVEPPPPQADAMAGGAGSPASPESASSSLWSRAKRVMINAVGLEKRPEGYDPLEETPRERLLLGIGLCIVLPMGICNYVFWSTWDPRDHL